MIEESLDILIIEIGLDYEKFSEVVIIGLKSPLYKKNF